MSVSPAIQKTKSRKNAFAKRIALRDVTNTPTPDGTTSGRHTSSKMTVREKRLAKRHAAQEIDESSSTPKTRTVAVAKAVEHSDAPESSRRTRSRRNQTGEDRCLSGMSDLADPETPMVREQELEPSPGSKAENVCSKNVSDLLSGLAEKFARADEACDSQSSKQVDEPEDVMMKDNDEDATIDAQSKTCDVPMTEPVKLSAAQKESASTPNDKMVTKSPAATPKQVLEIALSSESSEKRAEALGKIAAKSPGGRFKVDVTGNVTDKSLERLMNLAGAGPSKSTTSVATSSTKSLGMNVKSIFSDKLSTKSLGQSTKSVFNEKLSAKSVASSKPVDQSQKSILKRPPHLPSSRQTVAKTPGVGMPSLRKEAGPSSVAQPYGDISSSLFGKNKPPTTPSVARKDPPPLFAKSIFSAPMQPPPASSKKISFAPHPSLKETDSAFSKKRDAGSSLEHLKTPVSMLKRPRTGTIDGKSSLRKRLESVRQSNGGCQVAGPPPAASVQTPSNLSINYAPNFERMKSPATRAPNSVRFTKLQSLAAKSTATKTNDTLSSKSSEGKTPVSTKVGQTPQSNFGSGASKISSTTPATDDLKVEKTLPNCSAVRNELAVHTSKLSKVSVSTPGTGDLEIEKDAAEANPESKKPPRRSSVHSSAVAAASASVLVNANEIIDLTKDESPAQEVSTAASDRLPNNPTAPEASNANAPDSSVLSNLMTSVKSFMPATIFGYNEADQEPEEETEEMRAERLAEQARREDERREMEMIARREAQRLARKVEADEKQKRAEANRKARALAELKKDEDRKRKEADRRRKLRAENEARRAKRAEEEQKREARRKRVLEHQQRVREAEEKRRAELAAKEHERRQKAAAGAGIRAGAAGSSAMPPPSASKGLKTPNRGGLSGKKKEEEITSYEMSAQKRYNSEDEEEENPGKPIPKWAKNANVAKVHCEQKEDPDKLFKRITKVDLEQVFANAAEPKKRYRQRHSSAHWTRDRLTAKEELEYKKNAGFI